MGDMIVESAVNILSGIMAIPVRSLTSVVYCRNSNEGKRHPEQDKIHQPEKILIRALLKKLRIIKV